MVESIDLTWHLNDGRKGNSYCPKERGNALQKSWAKLSEEESWLETLKLVDFWRKETGFRDEDNFNFNFLLQEKYKWDDTLKNEMIWDEVNEWINVWNGADLECLQKLNKSMMVNNKET